MRTPLVAGNWKLNNTVLETRQLLADMLPGLAPLDSVDRLVCPPFTALSTAAGLLEGSGVALGAQDLFWEGSGAYTGEISAAMVAEFCSHVILGHSERRAYFHESDQTVNQKVRAALAKGLIPVVCVGETLEENEAGRAAEVVSTQLKAGLSGTKLQGASDLVIAYEPVWAIGTGRAATPEGADTLIRNVVRPTLSGIFSEAVAQGVRVLYGGSVKANNAAAFFAMPEIDGALVGGASLKADEFIGITRAAIV